MDHLPSRLTPHRRAIRLLVVDDDRMVRTWMVAALAETGLCREASLCRVEEAGSGAVAAGLVLRNHYDLILADSHLPDLDIARLLGFVREHRPTTVLVVLVTVATPEQCRTLLTLGAGACLYKPVSSATLHETIIACLERQEALLAGLAPPELRARVLVVQRDPGSGDVIARGLRHYGHQADIVAGGGLALLALERQPYHTVLTGIWLDDSPAYDGLTLAQEVHLRHPGTAVIVLTSLESENVRREAGRLGVEAFLVKPVDLETIERSVRRSMHGRVRRSLGIGLL